MKHVRIFLPCLLLLGCMQTNKPQKNEKYSRLFSKFKEISFDTLVVYSLSDGVNLEDYKFKGVQLDSTDAILFPQNIARAHFIDTPGLFACYKFKIDSTRLGLIARTPSEYFPSSIKLFIYTFYKDTLIEAKELAQYIGDAGALQNVNSWIFKDNQNIKVFTWLRDSNDNSVEDTTISIDDNFYIYDITKNKHESLGTLPDKLPKKLAQLLAPKASR